VLKLRLKIYPKLGKFAVIGENSEELLADIAFTIKEDFSVITALSCSPQYDFILMLLGILI